MTIDQHEIQLDGANFDKEVLESTIPVLVDFWASWCGPCKMIAPVISDIAKEYSGTVKVCKLNVDDSPEVASRYGIMSIPTLLIFKDGKIVDTITGAVPKSAIVNKLNANK